MSNNPVPAIPKLISSLDASLEDQKVRLAGISLSYDEEHQVLILCDDENNACLVDASLVLDSLLSIPGLREKKTAVTVVGYLELDDSPIPPLPPYVGYPELKRGILIRAILLIPSPDIDLGLWRESIQMRESAGIGTFIAE